MADMDDKEKAEKLAAAKKRFEQLKKQKSKKLGNVQKSEKSASDITTSDKAKTEDKAFEEEKPIAEEPSEIAEVESTEVKDNDPNHTGKSDNSEPSSLTLQSKIRSSSFRRTSNPQSPLSTIPSELKSPTLPPLSSSGESVTEIYRKQARRMEELDRENKRLTHDYAESERRRIKTETEIESLREASAEIPSLQAQFKAADAQAQDGERLKAEVAALKRQNAHLQSSSRSKHHPTPSVSSSPPSSTHQAMESEISTLRTSLTDLQSTLISRDEQIIALTNQLSTAQSSLLTTTAQVADLNKNLERASDRAVKEGSHRTSAETQLAGLKRDLNKAQTELVTVQAKMDALEKKNLALSTLHKESDTRSQTRSREADRIDGEAKQLRSKLSRVENELLSLREERERWKKRAIDTDGGDGAEVEELEAEQEEERVKLRSKVRELESEVYDLRKGVWKERRRELDGGPEGDKGGFMDVDLSGGLSPRVLKGGAVGLTGVISEGFQALTGVGGRGGGLLQEDGDGFGSDEFDEEAFQNAQEEEGLRRVERVREVKRGLQAWRGWRLDLVEGRAGAGVGWGEIFEV